MSFPSNFLVISVIGAEDCNCLKLASLQLWRSGSMHTGLPPKHFPIRPQIENSSNRMVEKDE